jgi:hypothetical protein
LAMRCMTKAWEKGASRKAAARIAASVLTKAAIDRGSKVGVNYACQVMGCWCRLPLDAEVGMKPGLQRLTSLHVTCCCTCTGQRYCSDH